MGPGATRPRRAGVAFGASATIVVAVGADTATGQPPVHTATLGMVALIVAALRWRLAGRHSGLFAAASAAIVAQPALHAAMKLVPAAAEHVPNRPGHAAAEASITVLHVLVATLITTAVAGAEQLFLLVATRQPVTGWLRLLLWMPPRPQLPAPTAPLPPAPATRWSFVTHAPGRGPPAAARAVAAA